MTASQTRPRVSVVLPTHNRPKLLAEALASIEAQTYPDWEVIVVDDGSEPPAEISAATQRPERVRVLRHSTAQGGAAAKTAGMALARGDIITFLDDDDLYAPEFLARTVATLDRWDEIEVLFVGVDWFGARADISRDMHAESTAYVLREAGAEQIAATLWNCGPTLLAPLLRKVPMPFQRPVVRTAALRRVGGYRRECLLWDCDWALRASLLARCALLDEPLYRQRFEDQGYFSQNDRRRAQFESALEMTRRLCRHPPIDLPARERQLLRDAVGQHAFYLADFLARRGVLVGALGAWWTGQRASPSLWNGKRLLGIVARALIPTGARGGLV